MGGELIILWSSREFLARQMYCTGVWEFAKTLLRSIEFALIQIDRCFTYLGIVIKILSQDTFDSRRVDPTKARANSIWFLYPRRFRNIRTEWYRFLVPSPRPGNRRSIQDLRGKNQYYIIFSRNRKFRTRPTNLEYLNREMSRLSFVRATIWMSIGKGLGRCNIKDKPVILKNLPRPLVFQCVGCNICKPPILQSTSAKNWMTVFQFGPVLVHLLVRSGNRGISPL